MKITVAALAAVGALALAPAAASASGCPDEPASSQVFAAFGDLDNYFLAPGGDFEAEAGWTLRDGAAVTAAGANSVLSLPEDASAVSPPICVAPGYPHGRMYGASGSVRHDAKVDVDVIYDGVRGEGSAKLKLRDSALAPTGRFGLDETRFGLDPETGTATVRIVFEGAGKATALLDDVYIDPRARN